MECVRRRLQPLIPPLASVHPGRFAPERLMDFARQCASAGRGFEDRLGTPRGRIRRGIASSRGVLTYLAAPRSCPPRPPLRRVGRRTRHLVSFRFGSEPIDLCHAFLSSPPRSAASGGIATFALCLFQSKVARRRQRSATIVRVRVVSPQLRRCLGRAMAAFATVIGLCFKATDPGFGVCFFHRSRPCPLALTRHPSAPKTRI